MVFYSSAYPGIVNSHGPFFPGNVLGVNQLTYANLETTDQSESWDFFTLKPPSHRSFFLHLSPLTPSIGSASSGPDW